MSLGNQAALLFVLAIPVACISWTVTHEDLFREFHDWCVAQGRNSKSLFRRKFFVLFTCEYCFSHYVAVAVIAVTGFHVWLPDWRGYAIAGFSLVWIANLYMSLFGRLRLEIRHERLEIEAAAEEVAEKRGSDTLP